jgi:hypothetical protein
MKKNLKVEVTKVPHTTYTYKYEYVDNKGVKVIVEGIPTMDKVESDIKKKFKKLSNETYKIVKKRS